MFLQEDILKSLKARDKATIEMIYRSMFPRIYGWISMNSGTREDAEDIFHDSLLAIIVKLDCKAFELTCDFSTYFISVCRNKWMQVLYRRKKQSRLAAEDNDMLFEDSYEQLEQEELENRKYTVFINALHDLDPRSQAVMEALLNGKSNEEIAKEQGFINVQAVADKKKNCKKRLIQILCNCIEYKELMNEELQNHRAYSK